MVASSKPAIGIPIFFRLCSRPVSVLLADKYLSTKALMRPALSSRMPIATAFSASRKFLASVAPIDVSPAPPALLIALRIRITVSAAAASCASTDSCDARYECSVNSLMRCDMPEHLCVRPSSVHPLGCCVGRVIAFTVFTFGVATGRCLGGCVAVDVAVGMMSMEHVG